MPGYCVARLTFITLRPWSTIRYVPCTITDKQTRRKALGQYGIVVNEVVIPTRGTHGNTYLKERIFRFVLITRNKYMELVLRNLKLACPRDS